MPFLDILVSFTPTHPRQEKELSCLQPRSEASFIWGLEEVFALEKVWVLL